MNSEEFRLARDAIIRDTQHLHGPIERPTQCVHVWQDSTVPGYAVECVVTSCGAYR